TAQSTRSVGFVGGINVSVARGAVSRRASCSAAWTLLSGACPSNTASAAAGSTTTGPGRGFAGAGVGLTGSVGTSTPSTRPVALASSRSTNEALTPPHSIPLIRAKMKRTAAPRSPTDSASTGASQRILTSATTKHAPATTQRQGLERTTSGGGGLFASSTS